MSNFEFDDEIITEQKQENKLQRPRMYRVYLHNDDYTPQEFVIVMLQTIFRKSKAQAYKIMLQAHMKGISVIGIYTYDIASTNIGKVEKFAEILGFPLRCTMEEIDI